jgi:integrase
VKLYRRHIKTCIARRAKDDITLETDERRRGYVKCVCPIHFEGALRSGFRRKGTGQTTWVEANTVAAAWETAGDVDIAPVVALAKVPAAASGGAAPRTPTATQDAIAGYLKDATARNLDHETWRKYRVMTRQLQAFADDKGLRFVHEWDTPLCTEFRGRWRDGARSGGKKLERFKSFFTFCVDHGWIDENPAEPLKAPVGASKPAGKYPFTDEELNWIFAACDLVPLRDWKNGHLEGRRDNEKVKTFIHVMVRTGLAITDTAFLSTEKVHGNDVEVRRTKTDEPVYTWVPDFLVERLKALPLRDGKHYFLLGWSRKKDTPAKTWNRHLKRAFNLVSAKIEDGGLGHEWKRKPTSHRFRHTFARILLQNGVSIANVAVLMGDKESTIIRHYGQWVPERQENLRNDMRRAFKDIPA